ncbi:MAG: 30S ribosomal protein S19e [Promethearchaeati archaeon SRVP18_Atabeyarchaeia-1]
MSTVYLVPANDFVKALSEELKKGYAESIKPPPWADFVKTAVYKTSQPTQREWWYIRCASVLRKIYLKKIIGVSRLRVEYRGPQTRGEGPIHSRRGGGSILRKMLQELETASLVEKNESKGRRLTPKGVSLLDRVAHKVRSSLQKEEIPDLKKY